MLSLKARHRLIMPQGNAGYIKWQDTSTGQLVAQHRTKLGQCSVLAPNPYNAVSLLGHHNGTVTMWAPNMSTPLVKMLCHKGPVQAVACDHSGRCALIHRHGNRPLVRVMQSTHHSGKHWVVHSHY